MGNRALPVLRFLLGLWLLAVPVTVAAQGHQQIAASAVPASSATDQSLDPPLPAPAQGQGLFVALSDLHFNPFDTCSLGSELALARAEDWDVILARPNRAPSKYGEDTNQALFVSALDSIASYMPKLDYLLFTGDFLAHDFREKYQHCVGHGSTAAYDDFVLKTMRYITTTLKRRFRDIPVVASLGNNDSDCGDNSIEPGGKFLKGTQALMSELLGSRADVARYPEFGAYVFPQPKLSIRGKSPNRAFVVIDNLYFSPKYRACGKVAGDPAGELLRWVDSTLTELHHRHWNVTLVVHLPFGIDSFASDKKDPPTPYLNASGEEFLKLLSKHRDQVTAIFAGHSHMDDFRVLADKDGPYAFERIVPSISPMFQNNPSYQVYSYDRVSGVLLDYLTRSYDPQRSSWTKGYDFAEKYGLGPLTATTLNTLAEDIRENEGSRAQSYIKYYDGAAKSRTRTPEFLRSLACALTNLDVESFQSCLWAKRGH